MEVQHQLVFYRHLHGPMFPRKKTICFADQVCDKIKLITCGPIFTKKLVISSSHWLLLISISSSISKTKEVNLCCVWKSRYRLLLALVSYTRVRIKLRCNNVASSSLSETCHLYECHFWRKTYVAFPILLNKCQQNLLVDRGSRHHCHWNIAEQPRRMFRSWDIQNGQKCWLCRSELPRTKLGRKQDRHTQRQGGDNMIQAGAHVVSSSQQVVCDWWQCAVVARYSVWDTQHR